MKLISLLFLLLFGLLVGHSQVVVNGVDATSAVADVTQLRNLNNRSIAQFDTRSREISGSQFLLEKWTKSDITLRNGKILEDYYINYDLSSDIFLIVIEKVAYEIPLGHISSFEIESIESDLNVEKIRFTKVKSNEDKGSTLLVEILEENGEYILGKKYSVKKVNASYIPAIDVGSVKPKMKKKSSLVIVHDGLAYDINRKRKKAVKELSDLPEVSRYIKRYEVNTKDEKELIEMIKKLNS